MDAALLVGAASVAITLPIGTPMGGYANRTSTCMGALDGLFARALLLQQGDTVCLMITLDALAINTEWAHELHVEAARACDEISAADVRVICSHTHSGAALSAMFGGTVAKETYFKQVIAAVRLISAQACERRTNCTLHAGSVQYPIGKNRRMRPGHANVTALEREQGAEIDHTLTALRFDDTRTGATVATLFHMACHPVCLGAENTLASGDYAGIAAQYIAQHTGAPALFLNGAAGNVTPLIGKGSTYAATQALGRAVGQHVLSMAYVDQPCELNITLRRQIALPLDCDMRDASAIERAANDLRGLDTGFTGWLAEVNGWRDHMLAQLAQDALRNAVEIPLSAVRIGETRFVLIGAEVFNEYQLWAPAGTRVVGYADGEGCYVPTAAALEGGGYEVRTAPVFYGLPCAPSAQAEQVLRQEIGD